jgi:3-hydroxybutyryl-CoA dehydrogenase
MSQGLAAGDIVAIVGGGVMGTGIAQVAALAGHPVRLYDHKPSNVTRALNGVTQALARLVERGRLSPAIADAARARVRGAAALSELEGAALVVEAVAESLDAKRTLFAALESIVGAGCILATNTSSISVTAIGAPLHHPERLVGMHFFNPAPVMALVEIVRGVATDRAVADRAGAIVAAWGKTPVQATSTPGFIVNRVARPFYGEALRLLLEGAGEPATIDAVLRDCGGFRMGPFELMDFVGLDINLAVTRSVFEAYCNDPRYAPSIVQQEMVNAGFLGRKTGRGYYRYGIDAAKPAAQAEPPQAPPAVVRVATGSAQPAFDALYAVLRARLPAAGVAVEESEENGPAFHAGGAVVLLTDGRSATQRADDDGRPDTVLFDLVADPDGAQRIALARADGCGDAAWHAAVGMFQAAGFDVTQLQDVPGMAAMRTVAMLANEAADAVNQGVTSAVEVDAAMRLGVNFPRGPLAWADAIGLHHVHTVLTHLAAVYGADRYRVSPLLLRRLCAPHGARFHHNPEIPHA